MKRSPIEAADLVSEDDLRAALQARIDAHEAQLQGRRGAQLLAAADLGVSQGALSNVLRGGRAIGADVANALGYRKVTRFERID